MDGVQWAGQAKFTLPAEEAKYIIAGFANPGQLFANGPKINGVKFMTTKADANVIVLKHGADGVICAKSKKAVTICKFSENDVSPANANVATVNFAGSMERLGY